MESLGLWGQQVRRTGIALYGRYDDVLVRHSGFHLNRGTREVKIIPEFEYIRSTLVHVNRKAVSEDFYKSFLATPGTGGRSFKVKPESVVGHERIHSFRRLD